MALLTSWMPVSHTSTMRLQKCVTIEFRRPVFIFLLARAHSLHSWIHWCGTWTSSTRSVVILFLCNGPMNTRQSLHWRSVFFQLMRFAPFGIELCHCTWLENCLSRGVGGATARGGSTAGVASGGAAASGGSGAGSASGGAAASGGPPAGAGVGGATPSGGAAGRPAAEAGVGGATPSGRPAAGAGVGAGMAVDEELENKRHSNMNLSIRR